MSHQKCPFKRLLLVYSVMVYAKIAALLCTSSRRRTVSIYPLRCYIYYIYYIHIYIYIYIYYRINRFRLQFNLLILCKLCGAVVNKNTVKEVSYSCMQNMSSIIKSQNKKVINKDAKELNSCN